MVGLIIALIMCVEGMNIIEYFDEKKEKEANE